MFQYRNDMATEWFLDYTFWLSGRDKPHQNSLITDMGC